MGGPRGLTPKIKVVDLDILFPNILNRIPNFLTVLQLFVFVHFGSASDKTPPPPPPGGRGGWGGEFEFLTTAIHFHMNRDSSCQISSTDFDEIWHELSLFMWKWIAVVRNSNSLPPIPPSGGGGGFVARGPEMYEDE